MTERVDDAMPLVTETEANEADLQEQAEPVEETEPVATRSASVEVDEFDAAEQGREVDLDPDEYR
jgi:hypothetical protein